MRNIILAIIITASLTLSCENEQVKIDPDNLLIGTWIYKEYSGDAAVYSRDDEFTDSPCYRFNPDGTLVERKNAGWCGTPPVTYADYDGKWTIINDTLISITSAYWGGTTTYKLDIEELQPTSLKVVYVEER